MKHTANRRNRCTGERSGGQFGFGSQALQLGGPGQPCSSKLESESWSSTNPSPRSSTGPVRLSTTPLRLGQSHRDTLDTFGGGRLPCIAQTPSPRTFPHPAANVPFPPCLAVGNGLMAQQLLRLEGVCLVCWRVMLLSRSITLQRPRRTEMVVVVARQG